MAADFIMKVKRQWSAEAVLALALTVIVGACNFDGTEIRDYAAFDIYEFEQRQGLGFCPNLDRGFAATIKRADPETMTFTATTLRQRQTDLDKCPEKFRTETGCFTTEKLPSRVLSSKEAALVASLFSKVEIHLEPDSQCQTLAIDPCRIEQHGWDQKSHSDYICSAERLSETQARALAVLLSDLMKAE